MRYKLKVYSIQEFGQRKDSEGNPHQEDSLFPEFGKQTDSDRLFILCDGMGGHDAGEVASQTVCEAMSQSVLNDGHDADGVFTDADFNNALNAAFAALDAKDNGAAKKMGTTMTFLKLHNGGAFIAHMGDSRVYHIRPGKDGESTRILFETRDHSLVNDLVKSEVLTREEARHSKQKNVITRAMQPNMDRQPRADIHKTADIKAGDYFYMCSDGMLEQDEMEDGTSLRNIFSAMGGDDENKVEILTSVTEKNKDNHTAFIIHITEVMDPIESAPAQEEKPDKFAAIVEEDEEATDSKPSDAKVIDEREAEAVKTVDVKATSEKAEDKETTDTDKFESKSAAKPEAAKKEVKVETKEEAEKEKMQLPKAPEAMAGKRKVSSLSNTFILLALAVIVILLGFFGLKGCGSEEKSKEKPGKVQINITRGGDTPQVKPVQSHQQRTPTAAQNGQTTSPTSAPNGVSVSQTTLTSGIQTAPQTEVESNIPQQHSAQTDQEGSAIPSDRERAAKIANGGR